MFGTQGTAVCNVLCAIPAKVMNCDISICLIICWLFNFHFCWYQTYLFPKSMRRCTSYVQYCLWEAVLSVLHSSSDGFLFHSALGRKAIISAWSQLIIMNHLSMIILNRVSQFHALSAYCVSCQILKTSLVHSIIFEGSRVSMLPIDYNRRWIS